MWGTRLSCTALRTSCRPSGWLRMALRSSMASVACEGMVAMKTPGHRGERQASRWGRRGATSTFRGPGVLPEGLVAQREAGVRGHGGQPSFLPTGRVPRAAPGPILGTRHHPSPLVTNIGPAPMACS